MKEPVSHQIAPSRIEHGVDEFEHGVLIGGRELFNTLQAFQQARGFERKLFTDRLQSEQRIRRDVQRAREIDEPRTGGLRAFGLVIRNDALRHAVRIT